jgi:hypothetical protein
MHCMTSILDLQWKPVYSEVLRKELINWAFVKYDNCSTYKIQVKLKFSLHEQEMPSSTQISLNSTLSNDMLKVKRNSVQFPIFCAATEPQKRKDNIINLAKHMSLHFNAINTCKCFWSFYGT